MPFNNTEGFFYAQNTPKLYKSGLKKAPTNYDSFMPNRGNACYMYSRGVFFSEKYAAVMLVFLSIE